MRPLVLVADRDPFFLALLEAAVHGSGCEVMVALDGHDALACVARYTPALVILDLGLPEPDGIELLRILRAEPDLDGIHIVLAGDRTAYENPQISGNSEESLVPDAWVARPYRVVELQATIASLLRRAREDRRREREQRRSEIPAVGVLGNAGQLLLAIEHEVTQTIRLRRPLVCLVAVAEVERSAALHQELGRILRASDMVFESHIEGEAVALLPETDEQGGATAIDRLRRALGTTISVGLAVCPVDGKSAKVLLQIAREGARKMRVGNGGG